MANPDLKNNASSSLSADAESFVPSHLKNTANDASETSSNSSGKVTEQQLPHYMTSCYPFVGPGDNNIRSRNPNWQHRGSISTSQTSQLRSFPAPGMFTFTGSRPPGPQNFNNQRMSHHVPRNYNQLHQPQHSPGSITSPLSPQAQPRLPGSQVLPQSQMPGLLPTPPLSHQALLPTPAPHFRLPVNQGPAGQTPQVWLHQASQGLYNQGFPQTGPHIGMSPMGFAGNQIGGKMFEKGKGRQKKKEWNQMVSIGIQNESGSYPGNQIGSKKKNRPRTIMCMDANVQTDFSDELANKTLAEKPSSIYQKEWTRNWLQLYQDSTTESEEVDSDSGYSSPMHRRNQASSGTHPLTAGADGGVITYTQGMAPPQQNYQVPVAMFQQQQENFSGYAQAVIGGYNKNRHPGEIKPYHKTSTASLNPAVISDTSGDISIVHSHHHAQHQVHQTQHHQHHPQQQNQTKYHSNKSHVVVQSKTTVQSGLSSYNNSKPSDILTNNTKNTPSGALTNTSKKSANKTSGNIECEQNSYNTTAQTTDFSVSKTEGEEEDGATSSGSKRKKKRNRRRKKKSKSGASSPDRQGGASGGMSDGPYDLHRAHSSSNVSRTSTLDNDILHFEDENEFPNLLSAVGGLSDGHPSNNPSSLSYSDILKGHHSNALSQESAHSFSSGGFKSSPESSSVKSSKEGKNARKRRKRQEAVDHAADVELAEITLEQQVLKELSAKSQKTLQIKEEQKQQQKDLQQKQQGGGGKKSKQPISLSIADMISQLEKDQQNDKMLKSEKKQNLQNSVANVLDSNAPKKRGKERETPKTKKPSPLKKVILKEREEKKRLRLLEDGVTVEQVNSEDEQKDEEEEEEEEDEDDEETAEEETEVVEEQEIAAGELSQEAASSIRSSLDIGGTGTGTGSVDLSPISQTSPISMSPLSGSPCNSGFNSPIASNSVIGAAVSSSVLTRIHSRRFREYCTQILDKDIDNCCSNLLQELVRFQDRVYHKDPSKAKSKRRIVLGLREVTKHLNLKKIKCVVISPNLERIQSKGGLDEALNNIINECQLQNIPFVFALGRRALGRACAKLVPVSVVGVFSYEGCEEYFKNMMELTEKARQAYTDMISVMEKELLEQEKSGNLIQPLMQSSNSSSGTSDMVPKLFPHMGHSRTPSACSAISFCSSILSEPISENYPHSEPETDSRGYEIVKDKTNGVNNDTSGSKDILREKLQRIEGDDVENDDNTKTSNNSPNKICAAEIYDIDEGHEADTEDDPSGSINRSRVDGPNNTSGKAFSSYYNTKFNSDDHDSKDELSVSSSSGELSFIQNDAYCTKKEGKVRAETVKSVCSDDDSDTTDANSQCQDRDTVQDLPHIESIHTSSLELNSEILSQHSSKTVDLNSEVLSTHSSKTVEAAGSQTPDRSSRNMGSASDLREASTTSGSGAKKVKTLDKERIESWVLETQKQIEMLHVNENGESGNRTVHSEHECNGVVVNNSSADQDMDNSDSDCANSLSLGSVCENVEENNINGVKCVILNNNGVENNDQVMCEDGLCNNLQKT